MPARFADPNQGAAKTGLKMEFYGLLFSAVPEFNCRGIPNCNQPYSFHHKAIIHAVLKDISILPLSFIMAFSSYNDIQASLADITAEDFKKAVTSTPLAGQPNIMIHHRH